MFHNLFQLSNSSLNFSLNRGEDNNDDYLQYLYENSLESFYPNNIEPNSSIEIPIKKENQEIQNTQTNRLVVDNNTKFVDILNSNFKIPGIEENEMKDEDDDLNSKKSTREKSENNNNNITKVIFGVQTKKKFELRVDYAIKNIKVYISKYMKEYGNNLIRECNFPNRLQKLKLFLPSYQYFTGNANEKLNRTFLNLTVEEILAYPKEKMNQKKDNRLQRQNQEMIDDFAFLNNDDLIKEIVIDNPNRILDMVQEIEVIIDTHGVPFSPRVRSDDGETYLDCKRVVTDLVYDKATSWYGDPLPFNIEERIAKELYGDIVYNYWHERLDKINPDISNDELEKLTFKNLHESILKGYDEVHRLVEEYVINHWITEDGDQTPDAVEAKVKKSLGGIIGGGFDPIYLIAQRLVKHSNDDGYIVGSRGSVGSSFVATLMGITEVNPLAAHYRCLKCKYSIFNDEDGVPYGKNYSSGFDLPDMKCPNCGEPMKKDGQDMPFATFLGY